MSNGEEETKPKCEKSHHFMNIRSLDWKGLTLQEFNIGHMGSLKQMYSQNFPGQEVSEKHLDIISRYKEGTLSVIDSRKFHGNHIIGCIAALPINAKAVTKITYGIFDGTKIEESILAPDFDSADAIYWWVVMAKGRAVQALKLVELTFNSPPFAGKSIYTKAETKLGLASIKRIGFEPVSEGWDGIGDFFVMNPVNSGRAQCK